MIYTLLSYLWLVASIPFIFFSVIRLSGELHLLQQCGYRYHRYRTLTKPKFREHTKELIALAAPVPLALLGGTVAEMVALVLWVLAFLLMIKNRDKTPAKQQLRFTERAIRLYVCILLLYFIPVVALLFVGVANEGISDMLRGIFLAVLAVLPFCAPFFVSVANFLLQPLEKKHNRRYCDEARTLLSEYPDLIKIAVAGTDDKTAVSSVLERMLAEKYCVLAPRGSYHTLTDLIVVIREELKPHHQVLLTAMTARQEGDIQELCDLVTPRYGLLTAVGPEPETEEAIGNTPFELIDSLPENGVAVMNFDDAEICVESDRMQGIVVSYGIKAKNLDFWAEDIDEREQATEFTLCARDGSTVELRTRLRGINHVYDIIGAAALATQLGVTFKQIKRAVLTLIPEDEAEKKEKKEKEEKAEKKENGEVE